MGDSIPHILRGPTPLGWS